MVNAGPNDRNMEILLYADHTQEDEYYNGGSLSYGGGGAPDNFAGWMMNWNYTDARSADNQAVINRIAEQCYGRPWTRMAPPLGVFTKTFADKVNVLPLRRYFHYCLSRQLVYSRTELGIGDQCQRNESERT